MLKKNKILLFKDRKLAVVFLISASVAEKKCVFFIYCSYEMSLKQINNIFTRTVWYFSLCWLLIVKSDRLPLRCVSQWSFNFVLFWFVAFDVVVWISVRMRMTGCILWISIMSPIWQLPITKCSARRKTRKMHSTLHANFIIASFHLTFLLRILDFMKINAHMTRRHLASIKIFCSQKTSTIFQF
jgi:hypothetical protein